MRLSRPRPAVTPARVPTAASRARMPPPRASPLSNAAPVDDDPESDALTAQAEALEAQLAELGARLEGATLAQDAQTDARRVLLAAVVATRAEWRAEVALVDEQAAAAAEAEAEAVAAEAAEAAAAAARRDVGAAHGAVAAAEAALAAATARVDALAAQLSEYEEGSGTWVEVEDEVREPLPRAVAPPPPASSVAARTPVVAAAAVADVLATVRDASKRQDGGDLASLARAPSAVGVALAAASLAAWRAWRSLRARADPASRLAVDAAAVGFVAAVAAFVACL